jgi:hypothetical protein
MMIDYVAILIKHYSNDKWSLNGNEYSGLTWLSDTPKPSQEELESHWNFVEKDINSNTYKAQRAREYPSFADQFDTLYHGGYDAWKAQIDAIKLKYPKP